MSYSLFVIVVVSCLHSSLKQISILCYYKLERRPPRALVVATCGVEGGGSGSGGSCVCLYLI